MGNYLKLIYEDWEKKNGTFSPVLKESLVPFGEPNTIWLDESSYDDNFEFFVQDVFECGFLFLNEKVITIFQIKNFSKHKDGSNQKNKSRKSRNPRSKNSKKITSRKSESNSLNTKTGDS